MMHNRTLTFNNFLDHFNKMHNYVIKFFSVLFKQRMQRNSQKNITLSSILVKLIQLNCSNII